MVICDPIPGQPDFFSTQVRKAQRFYLDLKSNPRRGFSVICGGYEECASDYAIDRRAFPFLTLEFVLAGQGKLSLLQRDAILSAGIVFIYGPETPHQMSADPAHPPRKYFVNFAGAGAAKMLRDCRLEPGTICSVAAPSAVQRNLDELIEHGSRGGRTAGDLCDALFKYLLLRIGATAAPINAHHSPAYSTYLRCREHVERHYIRLHTLREIANETRIDEAYICRLFKRFESQSPYQTLIRLKMNAAAELLLDTEMLVRGVAEAVGYSDVFHFSRTFKQAFGVSPQAFRRLNF